MRFWKFRDRVLKQNLVFLHDHSGRRQMRRVWLVGDNWFLRHGSLPHPYTYNRLLRKGELEDQSTGTWSAVSAAMALWYGAAPESDHSNDPRAVGPAQFGQGQQSATAVLSAQKQQNAMMNQYAEQLNREVNQKVANNVLGALAPPAPMGMGGAGFGTRVPPPPPNPLAPPHGAPSLYGYKLSPEELEIIKSDPRLMRALVEV